MTEQPGGGSMKRMAPGVVICALLASACLVQVTHVKDPGPAFRDARSEVARFQGRPGPAHEINVLVWSPDEHELVRVSVPLWMVRKAAEHADWDDLDFDGDDHVQDALKRRGIRPQDLEKLALGTLVEVEEDDGEQVLVWLR
jgi:hypothetical protein